MWNSSVGRIQLGTFAGGSNLFLSDTGNVDIHADIANSIGSSYMALHVDGTEAMRINLNKNILIGTTADRIWTGTAVSRVLIEGLNADDSSLHILRNSNDASPGYLVFTKTRGTSIGSVTSVSDGDGVGTIYFRAADGTDIQNVVAIIDSHVDGTPSSNIIPGRVRILTRDSSGSTVEAFRVDSSQNIGFQKTPEATHANFVVTWFGGNNSIMGDIAEGTNKQVSLLQNSYYHTTGAWRRVTNDETGRYRIRAGEHRWYSTEAGTADTDYTQLTRMVLTSNDISTVCTNLLVGGHETPYATSTSVSTIEVGNHAYGRLLAAGTTAADLALYDINGTTDRKIFYVRNADNYTKFKIATSSFGLTQDDVFVVDMTTGRIGIGKVPDSTDVLHIYRSSNAILEIESYTSNAYLYLNSNTDNAGTQLSNIYFQDNSANKWKIEKTTGNHLVIHDYGRPGTVFELEDNGNMLLMENGGNVGIGTSSIDEKLHIQNTGACRIVVESDGTGDTVIGGKESGTTIFNLFNDHSDSKLRLANYLDEPIELSINRGSSEKVIATFDSEGIEAPNKNFYSGELNFTSNDSVISITPGALHGMVLIH